MSCDLHFVAMVTPQTNFFFAQTHISFLPRSKILNSTFEEKSKISVNIITKLLFLDNFALQGKGWNRINFNIVLTKSQ